MPSIHEHFIHVRMTRNLKRYQLCWITACWAGIKSQSNMHKKVPNHFEAGETAALTFPSFTQWARRGSWVPVSTAFVGGSNRTAQPSKHWRICSNEQPGPKTVPYCSQYGLIGPSVRITWELVRKMEFRLHSDLLTCISPNSQVICIRITVWKAWD